MALERKWRLGLCSHCLTPLDPTEIGRKHSAFCSSHCQQQAMFVRYLRGVIRDGRCLRPDVLFTILSNHIPFLSLDLAYLRPRIKGDLRQAVLERNDGLCVICNDAEATEIDHISGGSEDPSNLRGLCRGCHMTKVRGPIPADLTRGDSLDSVDSSVASDELRACWHIALMSGSVLGESDAWEALDQLAHEHGETRFGWITIQILADEPTSPAHDEKAWNENWRDLGREYREWAARALEEKELDTAEQNSPAS